VNATYFRARHATNVKDAECIHAIQHRHKTAKTLKNNIRTRDKQMQQHSNITCMSQVSHR